MILRSAILVSLLFSGAAAAFAPATSDTLSQSPHPAAGAKAAVKDPEVVDLSAFQRVLSAQRGHPLLLSIWATWCEPCRDEYPMVNELAKQYAPQGLRVVGISYDDDAEINLVRHFLARNNPIFPNYRKRMGHVDQFDHGIDPTW
ncbi:MAG TPA: TlpA disulfide reductase family protein, partial [Candidatus Acidoferrales bacterium]|nr:TlpA disulfide reductase family protein [Candidatus Acidoferrales bacterium]